VQRDPRGTVPQPTGLLAVLSVAIAVSVTPGCSCGPTERFDAGARPDELRDAPGGGGADDVGGGAGARDAWPDPRLDADLDAFLDLRFVDANLTDANSDVGPIDAFRQDVGIFSIDGGPPRDTGRTRDTGPDARVPEGACGILWSRGDPIPGVCLPRCSRTTRDLFDGCFGDGVCEAQVMVMDITPYADMYVWEEAEFAEVDCEGCVGTQRFSCWHERCPTQAERWVDCVSTRGAEACMRDREILDRCLAPYLSAVERCSDERVALCFPAP